MSDDRSAYIDAARAVARARRYFLLGRPGPWYQRATSFEPGTTRLREHGTAVVGAAALISSAEDLDIGLKALGRATVERPGEERCSPIEALFALATEDDPEERIGLGRAVAQALGPTVELLGQTLASAAETAAEAGAVELVSAEDAEAARRLLAATGDAHQDVLDWATLRLGRSRRKAVSWGDCVRVLRAPLLDDCLRPPVDPWPTYLRWREAWGMPVGPARFELGGPWPGSWAIRMQGRNHVGVAGWPGSLRWRMGLQAIGRWDVLREAGDDALLPNDSGSAELLGALYCQLLADPAFAKRAVKSRELDRDASRQLALSELLLARLQAAALLTLKAFEESRALSPLREAAADHFHKAVGAAVPPDVSLLLCRPWAPPLSSPRAAVAASALTVRLREAFDVDWWRNPRAVPELRRLASRAAADKLEELVPGGASLDAYNAWINESLGG